MVEQVEELRADLKLAGIPVGHRESLEYRKVAVGVVRSKHLVAAGLAEVCRASVVVCERAGRGGNKVCRRGPAAVRLTVNRGGLLGIERAAVVAEFGSGP